MLCQQLAGVHCTPQVSGLEVVDVVHVDGLILHVPLLSSFVEVLLLLFHLLQLPCHLLFVLVTLLLLHVLLHFLVICILRT